MVLVQEASALRSSCEIIRRANGETGARARHWWSRAPLRALCHPSSSVRRVLSSRSPPLIENLSCAHRRRRNADAGLRHGRDPRAPSDRGAYVACRRLAFCAQFGSSSGAHIAWQARRALTSKRDTPLTGGSRQYGPHGFRLSIKPIRVIMSPPCHIRCSFSQKFSSREKKILLYGQINPETGIHFLPENLLLI